MPFIPMKCGTCGNEKERYHNVRKCGLCGGEMLHESPESPSPDDIDQLCRDLLEAATKDGIICEWPDLANRDHPGPQSWTHEELATMAGVVRRFLSSHREPAK